MEESRGSWMSRRGRMSSEASASPGSPSPTPEAGLSRRFWESTFRLRTQSDTSLSRLIRRARAKSRGKSRGGSREDNVTPEEVDPVYMAIKQAGELYAKNRAKTKSSANSSAADLRKQDSLGSRGSLSSNPRGSDPNVGLRVSSGTPSGTPSRKVSASEHSGSSGASAPRRRPPQLDNKMKSLSLDSPDATPYVLNLGKGKCRAGHRSASPNAAARNARLLSAPKLIKNCSIETDETDQTSASASPCPSPANPGSATSISPNSSDSVAGWVATREYRQRCPEDLGIVPGDFVHIIDTSDPQWFHGFKAGEEHVGIFPVTCVAKVLAGERVAQCVQNLTLSHPPRQIRLHKEQILFTHGLPGPDKTIPIRTEKNYRATCPVQYLVFLS